MPPLNPCPPFNASVLLVDDEPDVLEVLQDLLTSQMPGAIVDRADSGRAALERLAATDYDVVVSDVVMPGMSGLELLERIRAIRPGTPVVLMTGFSERDLIVRALRGGAYDFIQKPIDHNHFLATVARAVQVRCLSCKVVEQKAALERHTTELERIVEERTQALRQSEERFRLIMNNAHDAIFYVDLAGVIQWTSHQAVVISGRAMEEMVGRSFMAVLTPEAATRAEARLAAIRRGESVPPLVEFEVLRPDGSVVWVEANITGTLEDGKMAGRLLVARDITERKRAEKALYEGKERLRVAYDLAPVGICEVDSTGRFLRVNQRYCDITGYTKEELLTRCFQDITHPDDVQTDTNLYRQLQSGMIPFYSLEKRYIHKDGRIIWIELYGALVRNADGGLQFGIGVVQDITERKLAEEALRESEQQMRLFTLATNDSTWNWDMVACSVARSGFDRAFGYSVEEVVPSIEWWEERLHPDDRERVLSAFRNAVARGSVACSYEYRFRRREGSYAMISDRAYIVRDQAGTPVRALGAMTDITEQRQVEAERLDLYERLQESHKGLRTLSQRLLEAQELERRRIARELHDETGQTLTSLLIGMRTLEEMPMRAAVRKRVSELRKTVAHAINEIKRLALGLHPSVLDDLGLETALRRLTEEFAQAHGFMVDLHMSGLDGNRLPLAVETILYRISQEALTNVAKHAGDARVSILLQCSPSAAKVIIEDDGRGFDVQTVLKSAVHSNHMGLHGMRERAASLNGSIEIESTPGGGTTIYVHVPIGRGSA